MYTLRCQFYHGCCKYKRYAASLFYDIPRYVTMRYKKRYSLFAICEEVCRFEIQNHVKNKYSSRLRYRAELAIVYSVNVC